MEDVLIIGGGAAGLNAALTLGRARRRVLVVDSGQPRNAPAERVHGYLSRDGTPPGELLAIGRSEIERYGSAGSARGLAPHGSAGSARGLAPHGSAGSARGLAPHGSAGSARGLAPHGSAGSARGLAPHGARIVAGEVRSIRRYDGGFRAELGDGVVEARRIVIATGLRDELPDIPGLRERWARDVLHCPYCHGWEVRDQPLGVLGLLPRSVHLAWLLPQWSADVVLFAEKLEAADREKVAARGVRIVEDKVIGIEVADDKLRGVRLANGDVVPRSALFVAGQFIPNDDLLTELGCAKDEKGWVQVDRTGLTSVPGVWAAGNVVDPSAQVISAAAAGALAAATINADLIDD